MGAGVAVAPCTPLHPTLEVGAARGERFTPLLRSVQDANDACNAIAM
jgi:hypothetical protein